LIPYILLIENILKKHKNAFLDMMHYSLFLEMTLKKKVLSDSTGAVLVTTFMV